MCTEIVTPRIAPLEAPFDAEIEAQLTAMMPAGLAPIALFRTLVRNLPMAKAMGAWGSYELSRRLSLSMRDREIVIERTCARCGSEYEWGIHVALFADRVGLGENQVASLCSGTSTVDALHEASDLPDELWTDLSRIFTDANLLDLLLFTGWYHAISFVGRAARVPLETDAPRFTFVATRRP